MNDYDLIDARVRIALRDLYVPPPRLPRAQWTPVKALLTLVGVYGGCWLLVVGGVYLLVRHG